MIITIKDLFKMAGILAVAFCAVIVCAMFLNFNLDLLALKQRADFPVYEPVYKIMEMNGKVICGVSGGCLFLTSIVLLCFYIGHYIDTHKKELGILKALGYSRLQMAVGFSAFGGCVLAGTGLGYGASWLFLMPRFYEMQNKDGLLPEIRMHFHPWLFLALVAAPTAFFALLAIFYSYHKLGVPALSAGNLWHKGQKSEKGFLPAFFAGAVPEQCEAAQIPGLFYHLCGLLLLLHGTDVRQYGSAGQRHDGCHDLLHRHFPGGSHPVSCHYFCGKGKR